MKNRAFRCTFSKNDSPDTVTHGRVENASEVRVKRDRSRHGLNVKGAIASVDDFGGLPHREVRLKSRLFRSSGEKLARAIRHARSVLSRDNVNEKRERKLDDASTFETRDPRHRSSIGDPRLEIALMRHDIFTNHFHILAQTTVERRPCRSVIVGVQRRS